MFIALRQVFSRNHGPGQAWFSILECVVPFTCVVGVLMENPENGYRALRPQVRIYDNKDVYQEIHSNLDDWFL